MKHLRTLSLATALLAAPTLALCGIEEPPLLGSVGNVTFALTFSFTAPNVLAKDETGKTIIPKETVYSNEWNKDTETKIEHYYEYLSKITSVKYGNKEFLQDLIDTGVLDAESITGWSIVQVTPTFERTPNNSESASPHFLAVHAGEEPVDVTDSLSGHGFAYAETATKKETVKGPDGEPENQVTTVSDTLSWQSVMYLDIMFPAPGIAIVGPPPEPEVRVSLQGFSTGSQKQVYLGTGVNKRPLQLIGAQKVSAITGEGPQLPLDAEEEPESSVVQGTIGIGAGKAVADVTATYGVTLPIEED